MSELQELRSAAGRSLARLTAGTQLPGLHIELRDGACLAISGLPSPAFNIAAVWDEDPQPHVEDAARMASERGVPVVVQGPEQGGKLGAAARGAGFHPVATMPYMAADLSRGRGAPGNAIHRLTDPREWATARSIIVTTFGLEPDLTARAMNDRWPVGDGLAAYALRSRTGEALSVVTTTEDDGVLGIWNMATPLTYRRRGFARELLTSLLADASARGLRTAILISTVDGYALYESLGFRLVEDWAVYAR